MRVSPTHMPSTAVESRGWLEDPTRNFFTFCAMQVWCGRHGKRHKPLLASDKHVRLMLVRFHCQGQQWRGGQGAAQATGSWGGRSR